MTNSFGHTVVLLFIYLQVYALILVEAQLTGWNFKSFNSNSTSQLTFLGDAQISNATGPFVLYLNLDGANTGKPTAGKALFNSPVQFSNVATGTFASFSTNFTFAIDNIGAGPGCGGFTFQLGGDNTSLGDSGQYLGLTTAADDGAVSNALFAVEFDTSPDVSLKASHIGVDINSVKSLDTDNLCPSAVSCTNLTNSGHFTAQIVYTGLDESLSVMLFDNSTNLVGNLTVPSLSLLPVLKQYMFVGFSGSNEIGCNQTTEILSWSFVTSRSTSAPIAGPPPPPTTYTCYMPGGCSSTFAAWKIGIIAAIGGGIIIFALALIYVYYYRRKQYSAVTTESKSGPPTSNPATNNGDVEAQNKAIPPEAVSGIPIHNIKGREVSDPKAVVAPVPMTETVVKDSTPNAVPADTVYEPKPVPPVAEPVNRNADGKVTMCCVQTRPKRDFKEPVVFSYKELAQATKNFSDKELLGGTPENKAVYKGVLRDSGTSIAIKVLSLESLSNEFMSKAMLLGRIRHPNLVHLLGWCQEKGKLFLVYDYMPKGGLDKLLLLGNDAEGFLAFDDRYNVLTGVGAGLAYLHEEWERCVVHRDVKPSNVLLDANSVAHLGNFSHASLVEHNKIAESTVLDGTLGYMAPEIPYTGKPTTKSDVFSFGVLALELACGRLPLDWRLPEEERVLLDSVWKAHEEGALLKVVDKRLDPSFSPKQMTRLLQVGLYCCHPDPSMRPNMPFVWQILIGRAKVPELPDKKPIVQNYAALIPEVRNPGPLSIATSSDTQRRFADR